MTCLVGLVRSDDDLSAGKDLEPDTDTKLRGNRDCLNSPEKVLVLACLHWHLDPIF